VETQLLEAVDSSEEIVPQLEVCQIMSDHDTLESLLKQHIVPSLKYLSFNGADESSPSGFVQISLESNRLLLQPLVGVAQVFRYGHLGRIFASLNMIERS